MTMNLYPVIVQPNLFHFFRIYLSEQCTLTGTFSSRTKMFVSYWSFFNLISICAP